MYKRQVYDQRGMGAYQAQIEPDALEFLADIAGGDARAALNLSLIHILEKRILLTFLNCPGIKMAEKC